MSAGKNTNKSSQYRNQHGGSTKTKSRPIVSYGNTGGNEEQWASARTKGRGKTYRDSKLSKIL